MSGRLRTEELHQVKYLMGTALTLLSLWALLSLDLQSEWLILPILGIMAYTLIRPGWASRLPAITWRVATPLMILCIGADFLLNLPGFIPPLVRMVVLLLLYRNLAPRRQREDLQLILLCLFCLVLSGVMTVSLLFALQILVFTPMAMALLFVISLLDRGPQTEDCQLNWVDFKWSRLLRRIIQVLDWRVLSVGSLLFVFVVLISTVLFILTPRFNLDHAIPFLQVQTQPLMGFGEEVKLGDVTELQSDTSVAIRIDLPSLQEVDAWPYWRMLVLDLYSEGRFRLSDGFNAEPLQEITMQRELNSDQIPFPQRRGESWTFYIEGGVSRYLPVPGDYAALRFQVPQKLELLHEPHIYRLDRVGQSVFSYQIEDLRFNDRFAVGLIESQALLAGAAGSDLESKSYPHTLLALRLEPDDRSALAAINQDVLQGRSLPAGEYSRELSEWLGEKFSYSLRPDGQVGFASAANVRDPIVYWLEEGTRGHCELFASAFVLLARDAGFPSRLVVGFAGGAWNAVEDYFVLRNSDAHAWVEIMDRESNEWLRVDPTPSADTDQTNAALGGSRRLETGWGAWVDSLRIQWYRRIVNFEQQDQMDMAMSLKETLQTFTKALRARAEQVLAEIKAWLSQPFTAAYLVRGLVVLAMLLLGVFLFFLLWRVRYSVLSVLSSLLGRPKALHPVRRQARAFLRRLDKKDLSARHPTVIFELQALRFGPDVVPEQAQPVFARARKALRTNYAQRTPE